MQGRPRPTARPCTLEPPRVDDCHPGRNEQADRDRRPVTIRLLVAAGMAVVNSWRLEGAWPCRWSGPSLHALGNDVAIEELELAYDDLVWVVDPDRPPSKSPRSR